jgi:hypothetical protein
MSMDLAISNIKMAMEAFPNNLELIKLAVSHCEKLQEPAPKVTPKRKTVEAPKPQAPKTETTVQFDELPDLPSLKDVKAALIRLSMHGKDEDEKKVNRKKAHTLMHEITGVKKVSDVPEEKRKELIDAAREVLTKLSS